MTTLIIQTNQKSLRLLTSLQSIYFTLRHCAGEGGGGGEEQREELPWTKQSPSEREYRPFLPLCSLRFSDMLQDKRYFHTPKTTDKSLVKQNLTHLASQYLSFLPLSFFSARAIRSKHAADAYTSSLTTLKETWVERRDCWPLRAQLCWRE